jgi:DNA-binding NtrC family response regulator
MRILILEDDDGELRTPIFRQNLSEHDLVFTNNAEGAIRLLATEEFQAVFLDYDIEGLTNGLYVANFLAIRSLVGGQKPKIIIHSRNLYGSAAMKAVLPGAICWPGIWGFKEELKRVLDVLEG